MQASLWARSERLPAVDILCDRGEIDRARAVLDGHEAARDAEQRDIAAAFAAAEARVLCEEGRYPEARAAAERGLSHAEALGGIFTSTVRLCLFQAIEAALALDDLADAERMLDAIDGLMPGQLFPVIQAPGLYLRARLDARRGDLDVAERELAAAERLYAGEGMVFGVARTRLELAELLVRRERSEEAQPLAAQARETFETLGASPWIARADSLQAAELAPSGSSA
jgi:ATP/maltotriose-dependent transcriptional regulator MalT